MFLAIALNLIAVVFATNFIFLSNFPIAEMSVSPKGASAAEKISNLKSRVLGIKIINEARDIAGAGATATLADRLPVSENKPALPHTLEGAAGFNLPSVAGAVMDAHSSNVFFEKNSTQIRSIASLTKLMTALVFLEYNPGWEKIYQIKAEDKREGGKIYLFTGEKIKIRNLFYSSLVTSDNVATLALAKSTGMTEEEFVKKMNKKAKLLGLENTSFKDPIGLSDANVSTAKEIAKFAREALENKEISDATLIKKYEFNTEEGRKKIIYNTDDLLDIFPQNGVKILGGKTGHTEAAGYCFVGRFIDHNNNEIISVVLGGDTNSSRFTETHDLVEWVYKNYQW